VVEVRRSSDSTSDTFTAGQITNGDLVDFVNTKWSDTASSDNTADWTIIDGTIAFDTDKYVLTYSAATQWAFINQPPDLIPNAEVVFSVDVKSGTGGDVDVSAGASQAGSNQLVQLMGTSSSVWQTLTATYNASAITFDNPSILFALTSGNIEFKNFTVTQKIDGFVSKEYDQSGATVRDGTQGTTTEQVKIVSNGVLVTDGNSNVSTLWDGIDDDLDVVAGFAGLTAANVYAVTDNAGVVTLDTLTAQDISLATNLSTILTGLTYSKVTAVIIYPDATDQAGIQSAINDLYGI
jgi:hypothetical protein